MAVTEHAPAPESLSSCPTCHLSVPMRQVRAPQIPLLFRLLSPPLHVPRQSQVATVRTTQRSPQASRNPALLNRLHVCLFVFEGPRRSVADPDCYKPDCKEAAGPLGHVCAVDSPPAQSLLSLSLLSPPQSILISLLLLFSHSFLNKQIVGK